MWKQRLARWKEIKYKICQNGIKIFIVSCWVFQNMRDMMLEQIRS
jgi:hypothetical protein